MSSERERLLGTVKLKELNGIDEKNAEIMSLALTDGNIDYVVHCCYNYLAHGSDILGLLVKDTGNIERSENERLP